MPDARSLIQPEIESAKNPPRIRQLFSENESAKSIVKHIHEIDRTMKTLEKESQTAENYAGAAVDTLISLADRTRQLSQSAA